LSPGSTTRFVGRIRESAANTGASEIFLARDSKLGLPDGFRAYLVPDKTTPSLLPADTYIIPSQFGYVGDGDVVRLDPSRRAMSVLYRRNSPQNSFLLTERCDNYFVMCSQPPKEADDSWLLGGTV
jgi:hypothetical protein